MSRDITDNEPWRWPDLRAEYDLLMRQPIRNADGWPGGIRPRPSFVETQHGAALVEYAPCASGWAWVWRCDGSVDSGLATGGCLGWVGADLASREVAEAAARRHLDDDHRGAT